MSDTAQNSNADVNDIWSLPDPPAQAPQANASPQNPNDSHTTTVKNGGGFGRPGLAGGGEGGAGLESDAAQEEAERTAEIFKAPETLVTPEVGEKQKLPEVHPRKEKRVEEPQVVRPEKAPAKGRVVDQRTGKVKTHRVADAADSITKTADIKEQEFIEGVEQVHSIV